MSDRLNPNDAHPLRLRLKAAAPFAVVGLLAGAAGLYALGWGIAWPLGVPNESAGLGWAAVHAAAFVLGTVLLFAAWRAARRAVRAATPRARPDLGRISAHARNHPGRSQ